MGVIAEFFGFWAEDNSTTALETAESNTCPHLGKPCVKRLSDGLISGACSIKPARSAPVICCPIRLYADDYKILRDVAREAFDDCPELVEGPTALIEARRLGRPVVAVFGKNWGGELRLPKRNGRGSYFVDWILAIVDPELGVKEFVAVEVQTIDTTGNYRPSRSALLSTPRVNRESTAGLNWENVNKRIIPQLIYKGHVLQREKLCFRGLFFVCPTPVYEKLMERVGGEEHLTRMHHQPSSITFLAYDYAQGIGSTPGTPSPLELQRSHTTSVAKLQERFASVDLPEPNVYSDAITKVLVR